MRKLLFILLGVCVSSVCVSAQNKHSIGGDIDFSFNTQYSPSEIDIPSLTTINVNYKFRFLKYASIGAGFRAGGFQQRAHSGVEEYTRYHDLYKGTIYSPFVTLGLYYDLPFETEHCIFIENRLSYNTMKLNKYVYSIDNTSKQMSSYDIKIGYQYPVTEALSLHFFAGYNTFDYSKIDPEHITIKASTPLQLGLGLNFCLTK